MATRTTVKKKMILFVITTLTVLLGSCSATIYKVGDSDGWTAKDDTYYSWADRKEFHVGDSLVFHYDPNFNDVSQVSGALEYKFCDSSSPKAVYKTGHAVVTLTEPGSFYFVSPNHSQCSLGQKLDLLVIHDVSRLVPPPPPSKILPFGKMYKVGDSKGWKVYNSDFYYKLSEVKQSHVGDNLIFEYANKVNDVLEIRGDIEFKFCDPTSLIVKLTKPGVHYFISSKTGHCDAGLKLRVLVAPAVPKFSPIDHFIRWLRTFRRHH